MTTTQHDEAVERRPLLHDEQMKDAERQCVRCKLCGGKAVITDAGIGAGYYIHCENGRGWRAKCMIQGARLGGWAYNVMNWWNRLHALSATAAPAGEEVARLRGPLSDIHKAAKFSVALCDEEDRKPWQMIADRAAQGAAMANDTEAR